MQRRKSQTMTKIGNILNIGSKPKQPKQPKPQQSKPQDPKVNSSPDSRLKQHRRLSQKINQSLKVAAPLDGEQYLRKGEMDTSHFDRMIEEIDKENNSFNNFKQPITVPPPKEKEGLVKTLKRKMSVKNLRERARRKSVNLVGSRSDIFGKGEIPQVRSSLTEEEKNKLREATMNVLGSKEISEENHNDSMELFMTSPVRRVFDAICESPRRRISVGLVSNVLEPEPTRKRSDSEPAPWSPSFEPRYLTSEDVKLQRENYIEKSLDYNAPVVIEDLDNLVSSSMAEKLMENLQRIDG